MFSSWSRNKVPSGQGASSKHVSIHLKAARVLEESVRPPILIADEGASGQTTTQRETSKSRLKQKVQFSSLLPFIEK